MPGNSRRNREDLVKSELEYSDVSESEEQKTSEETDEDRSRLKKKLLKMMTMMTQKKFGRIIIL
jgi:hypothetical protein